MTPFVFTVIRYPKIGICILENFLLNLSNVQKLFFAKLFDFALTFLTILNPLFYNLKKHFYSFYCLQIRRTTIFKMKKVYFRREYSNPSKYKNQDFQRKRSHSIHMLNIQIDTFKRSHFIHMLNIQIDTYFKQILKTVFFKSIFQGDFSLNLVKSFAFFFLNLTSSKR